VSQTGSDISVRLSKIDFLLDLPLVSIGTFNLSVTVSEVDTAFACWKWPEGDLAARQRRRPEMTSLFDHPIPLVCINERYRVKKYFE
jgi:hypothetical protein